MTSIRGLAALWVVAYHAQTLLAPDLGYAGREAVRLGYIAVDIFFVLSGFIITVVHGELHGAGIGRFWLKRLRRVYPLHLSIMLALGLGAVVAGMLQPDVGRTWDGFLPSLLTMQPFLLQDASTWNPPSWSLGVELCCYIVFPFVIPAVSRLGPRGLGAVVAVLGVMQSGLLLEEPAPICGAPAVLRGLCGFFLGSGLARLRRPLGAVMASVFEAAATLCLLGAVALHCPMLVVAAGSALIWAASANSGAVARALSNPVLQWLGTISFSIYLLHKPVLGLLAKLPVAHVGLIGGAVLLAVLLPLSELTYRFIERPGRRLAPWIGEPRPRAIA